MEGYPVYQDLYCCFFFVKRKKTLINQIGLLILFLNRNTVSSKPSNAIMQPMRMLVDI